MFMHSIECKYAPSSFENTWPKNYERNNDCELRNANDFLFTQPRTERNVRAAELEEYISAKQRNKEFCQNTLRNIPRWSEFVYILLPYIPVCSIISAAINVHLLFIIYYLGCL
jgi:hypothetical protein